MDLKIQPKNIFQTSTIWFSVSAEDWAKATSECKRKKYYLVKYVKSWYSFSKFQPQQK